MEQTKGNITTGIVIKYKTKRGTKSKNNFLLLMRLETLYTFVKKKKIKKIIFRDNNKYKKTLHIL
jgi:hypothetical protein